MNKSELLDDIVSRILKIVKKGALTIVGIDGKGCSGKSTIAKSIYSAICQLEIPCCAISIDDFCNPRELRYADDILESLQVYHHNFDEELFDGILETAHSQDQLAIEVMTLHVMSNTYSTPINIHLPPGGILLVEGIHLFKLQRQKYFDLAMMIHIDDEVQLKRALIRDPDRGVRKEDIVKKYQGRYIPSYRHYLTVDKPFKQADMIIDNNDPADPKYIEDSSILDIITDKD